MSAARIGMNRLQELVRLHRMGTNVHEVARLLGMSPNTERAYREVLEQAGVLKGASDELPSLEDLRAVMLKHKPVPETPPQKQSSVETWSEQIETMLKKGARPKAIYDKLRLEEEGFDGSLWAVKRLCARLNRKRPTQPEDVAIPVETEPGEVAQVDFGYVGKLYDPERGVLRKAWVFVLVLGYSRHMFCRVVFDQSSDTWLALHVEAFAALGGVPAVLVPDNLKAAVIRAAFAVGDTPAIHRSYRELAQHYGFKIDPTPVRAPEKKGKVESGVKYAKNNFFKPRDFEDIDDANRRLDRWVVEIAGQRIHGTTGKRPLEVFEQEERAVLQPLPARRFETVRWLATSVRRDCKVFFDRRWYPVPWRFIEKDVWVRATPTTVAVYFEDERIATHERGVTVPPEVFDTYLPPHRADLRHRSKSYWLERADRLGPAVGEYIREVFGSDDVLHMLQTVQAMVTLLEKHPVKRARAACQRAHYYGNYKYGGLRDILRKGLDLEPLPTAVSPGFGRLESPRYARKTEELLQLPLEVIREPN